MKIFLSQDLFDFSQITAFPEEQNTLLPLGRKISKNHSFHRRREHSVATWQENSSASVLVFFQFKKITVFTEEESTVLPLGRKFSKNHSFHRRRGHSVATWQEVILNSRLLSCSACFLFPGKSTNRQIHLTQIHKYTSPHLRKYTGRQVSHDTNALDRK